MAVEGGVLGFADGHSGKLFWRFQDMSKTEISSLLCGSQIFYFRIFLD